MTTDAQTERADLIARIAVLEAALTPFAHFARIFKQQQMGTLVPKAGELYGIENRAGQATIDVEHLEAAARAMERPA